MASSATSDSQATESAVRHSRTNSTTSSTSSNDERGLVLSVANLKPKRPSSGNNNTSGSAGGSGPNSLNSMGQSEVKPALAASALVNGGVINHGSSDDLSMEAVLRELEDTKGQLKTKEAEVEKLSNIRDELENEVQELTASLFEEAHKMVGAANSKAAASERSLEEASMKIDGLETEVKALRTLVLTSTPSKPNRHLHPQIAKSNKKSPSGSSLSLKLNSSCPQEVLASADLSSSECACGNDSQQEAAKPLVDPVLHKEYMAWKSNPTMDKANGSEFLRRLYAEDVSLCLDFPNQKLAARVLEAAEANTISMSPIVIPNSKTGENDEAYSKNCALMEAPLLCHFRLKFDAEPEAADSYEISVLARNRIAASCECLNYLRYICQGLVKAHHNDVYWEIVNRRRKMTLARLGFSPD